MSNLLHSLKQPIISGLVAAIISAITLGIIAMGSHSVMAETVYVPIGQQGNQKQSIAKPKQGMTKAQVKDKFGQPGERKHAVGEPPISSWVYDDFTVYFEHEYVIHSVLTSQSIN